MIMCYWQTSYLSIQFVIKSDTIITGMQSAYLVAISLQINEVCIYWPFQSL
jgi:hypothetical protein